MNTEQAYAEVQRVTRARAKNFAYGIMLLPRAKRHAIAAIYAFAREVDDIADGDAPVEEKRARLEALREALDDPPDTAMHVALADARARYGIPRDALVALVEATGRAALLLHWYRAGLATERIEISRREDVPLARLTVALLHGIDEDVLYRFGR